MVEPTQRSEMRPSPQAEASTSWTEPVKRPGGTALLAGHLPRGTVPLVDKGSIGVMRNLSLRFRIDPNTHAITVLIVDPATRRVVRSVPPEALHKMSQGELVELRT